LVTFTLEELEMPWDYFLKFVGLKEQEHVPNSQNEGDASEEVMGVIYALKHSKNPQLNCQPGVSKIRVVAKYMPKVEGLVGG
jgi:hypothetical protein